jgi:hypothetical protein
MTSLSISGALRVRFLFGAIAGVALENQKRTAGSVASKFRPFEVPSGNETQVKVKQQWARARAINLKLGGALIGEIQKHAGH